jgi:zinc transporter 7
MLSIGQALATGGLLGDVFLHTLPHAIMAVKSSDDDGLGHGHDEEDHVAMIGLAILSGFLIFFIFDVLVRSFGHEHEHEHHNHDYKHNDEHRQKKSVFSSSTVILNLVADSLHNFTDGIAIGASFAGAAAATTTVMNSTGNSNVFLIHDVLNQIQSRGGLASLAVLFHVCVVNQC